MRIPILPGWFADIRRNLVGPWLFGAFPLIFSFGFSEWIDLDLRGPHPASVTVLATWLGPFLFCLVFFHSSSVDATLMVPRRSPYPLPAHDPYCTSKNTVSSRLSFSTTSEAAHANSACS